MREEICCINEYPRRHTLEKSNLPTFTICLTLALVEASFILEVTVIFS